MAWLLISLEQGAWGHLKPVAFQKQRKSQDCIKTNNLKKKVLTMLMNIY
jgi:hypothetical protein